MSLLHRKCNKNCNLLPNPRTLRQKVYKYKTTAESLTNDTKRYRFEDTVYY